MKLLSRGKKLLAVEPASPLFLEMDPSEWVNRDDAAFVDVMHTNSDTIQSGGISIYGPLGHIDYYPNGGLHQPGCTGQ